MIAWYIVPYKRDSAREAKRALRGDPGISRYCAMVDFQSNITSDNGTWTETEVLGDRAIVKVRASSGTLTILDANFKRLPTKLLNDSLVDLSANVKTAIKNELLDMGYNLSEIQDGLGDDIGQRTFKDLLRFISKRRVRPRYDIQNDALVFDGIEQSCRPVEEVDAEVN